MTAGRPASVAKSHPATPIGSLFVALKLASVPGICVIDWLCIIECETVLCVRCPAFDAFQLVLACILVYLLHCTVEATTKLFLPAMLFRFLLAHAASCSFIMYEKIVPVDQIQGRDLHLGSRPARSAPPDIRRRLVALLAPAASILSQIHLAACNLIRI